MHLQTLSLINFKNCEEAELAFAERVNCFVGQNGEGKTNLLDAIYYLSFCKSFFNPIDSQNIRHGEPFFVVQGQYDVEGKTEALYCGIKKGAKKQFKRNKKPYDRLADHIGLFPLVMISPADAELVYEGSEVRRKFIDGVIAQFNHPYLDQLLQYNRVLLQRNALLKRFAETRSFDATTLEVFDAQLVHHGTAIYRSRLAFIEQFIPIFQDFYREITGDKEVVGLEYKSHLHDHDFAEVLEQHRQRDRSATYTTAGIHKDDLTFLLGDHPIKKFGSQGQQKSYLVALKLAQFDFIKEVKKVHPLLLLDDVFDKLDSSRVGALMKLVSNGRFGQIFITDTDVERIQKAFEPIPIEPKIFEVQAGSVTILG